MSRVAKRSRAVGLVQIFMLVMFCVNPLSAAVPAAGSVELRITDHAPGIADFENLFVSLASISIHTKGAARNDGWIALHGETELIDIVPLKEGRYQKLAVVEVPAQEYDAVKIVFSQLTHKLHSGETADLSARDTIVATTVRVDTKEVPALVIDLYAENQTDHNPLQYKVKVKEVRIE